MDALYIEHANITVNNLNASVRFFQTAFPEFRIRGGGTSNGREWIHLGNDSTYFAINEATKPLAVQKDYASSGINHIGFVVKDVEAIADRLLDAGFKRDYPKQIEKFRIRDYFIDEDGNEFEFVQYLSEKIEERNSFSA